MRCASNRPRAGFTLIELLIVIGIIAILLSLLVGAIFKSIDLVRRTSTERTISKTHDRVAQRFEKLSKEARENEPLKIAYNISGGTTDLQHRQAKVIQLKFLILWSFPTSYREIVENYNLVQQNMSDLRQKKYTGHSHAIALYNMLRARKPGLGLPAAPATVPAAQIPPAPPPTTRDFYVQSGTCLAWIYETMGNLDNFSSSELKDTDGDGVKELCDAWGHPLWFYRYGNAAPANAFNDSADLTNRARQSFVDKQGFDPDDPEGLLDTLPAGQRGIFQSTFGYSLAAWQSQPNVYAPLVIMSLGTDGDGFETPPISRTWADNLDSYRWKLSLYAQ